jgi:hypothetical protein
MESLQVERWDHLGVVASVIKDLGIVEMVDACVCPRPVGQPCRSPAAAVPAAQPLRPHRPPSGRRWPAAGLLHPALASRGRGWGRAPGGAGENGRGAGRRRRGCTWKVVLYFLYFAWSLSIGASSAKVLC